MLTRETRRAATAGPAFAKMAWHVPPLFALLRFLDSMGRSSAVCLGAEHCCALLCFLLLSCCSVASARHVVQARRLPGPSQKLPTRSRIPGSFLEGPGSCDVLVPMPSCDGSASQTCRVMPARHKRAVHTHFYPAVLPPLLPTSICCARTTHRLFPPRRRPRANRDVEIGSMCCCARRVVIGPARAVCRVPRLLFRVALPVCRAGDEEEARAALLT